MNTYCVCSALQTILSNYDINISQFEIARNLTQSRNGFRADDEKIVTYLQSHNLKYIFYWEDQTPFNERDAVLEEMNIHNGIIGVDTHAYVLQQFQYPMVEMSDETNCVSKTLYELVADMQDTNGFFAIIKR